jgi:RNA polymerase sigma-70 factor (ECF subfamily)
MTYSSGEPRVESGHLHFRAEVANIPKSDILSSEIGGIPFSTLQRLRWRRHMTSEITAIFPEALETPLNERCESRPAPGLFVTFQPTVGVGDDVIGRSDDLLLAQVGQGDRDALSMLFRRHGTIVFNTAYRILRDHSEADDLRQEVFLYLFQRATHFDRSKSTTISWIIQITYHRAIDRRRYLMSRRHYKQEDVLKHNLPSSQGVPSTDAIDGKALVLRMRDDLTVDQQMTLDLHFAEGYSFREIANKSGQSVGNIRNHYYRALERLRSGLFPEKRT